MLKRIFALLVLMSSFFLLSAMGGKGSGFERAPRVEKNFAVVVVDQSGKQIDGDKFSWEGRIHIDGDIGMARAVVPFDKIKEIAVGEKQSRKVKVTIRLKDGSDATLEVDADARCFGEAGFGSFMLTMEEIKSISFK